MCGERDIAMEGTINADSGKNVVQRPGVTLAERHLNPEELAARAPRANYRMYAVFAIIATLIFLSAALVLWMDYSELMPA